MKQSIIFEKKTGIINQITNYAPDDIKQSIDTSIYDVIEIDPDDSIPTLEYGFIDSRRVSVKKKKLVVNDGYINVGVLKTARHDLLINTDWMTYRHRDQIEAGVTPTLSEAQWSELLAYRQSLRDWPLTGDYSESFPSRPEWMP